MVSLRVVEPRHLSPVFKQPIGGNIADDGTYTPVRQKFWLFVVQILYVNPIWLTIDRCCLAVVTCSSVQAMNWFHHFPP